jgi:hypothetical protein
MNFNINTFKKYAFGIIILLLLGIVSLLIQTKPNTSRLNKTIEEKVDISQSLKELRWIKATTTIAWSPRDAQSVVTWNNSLWLIGGLEGNDVVTVNGTVEYWNAPHKSDIWKSEDGLNWTLVTDNAPWRNRRSVSSVSFQDKMWVMAGWDQYNYKYTNDIWYTTDGLKWNLATSTTPRWQGREGQTTIVHNGKLWLMGGVNFTERKTLNDIWFSDDGYNWQQSTSTVPWSPRYDHALSSFKGRLYLTGGVHLNTHETDAEVWVSENGFDWEKRTPNWPSRHGHISLVYKDHLWMIGGWHQEDSGKNYGINDTWFTDDGINWTKVTADGPWTGREDHMGDVFKNKMWLTGGMDTNERWSNDVYYTEIPNTPVL